MKVITDIYNVYSYDELSEEAKDKAYENWQEGVDFPFLQDDLREHIHEALEDMGYKELSIITPLYDLSNCQGSGLMFEGTIEDKKGNVYTIKQYGHYYHERSTQIEGVNKKGEYIDTKKWEENVYIPLCQKIRDIGYDEIDYQQSKECFIEACEANEYTFLKDGTMKNC